MIGTEYSGAPLISLILSRYHWASSVFSGRSFALSVSFLASLTVLHLFPWALTSLLPFPEATLYSLNLFQTLCCFVGFCLAPLFHLGIFEIIIYFPGIWRSMLLSFSISVFNQLWWILWDFSGSSVCLSSSLLLCHPFDCSVFSATLETFLYYKALKTNLLFFEDLSDLFLFQYCFEGGCERMGQEGNIFRGATAARALDFNCSGVGIVTFWNFLSPFCLGSTWG